MWVLSREKIIQGSSEAAAFKKRVESIIAEKLPEFDLKSLVETEQGGKCKYVDGQ